MTAPINTQKILSDLESHYYSISDLNSELCHHVLHTFQNFENEFRPAGIGKNQTYSRNSNIRSDHIFWIDTQHESTPGIKEYLCEMEMLRQEVNRTFFTGLKNYECHFALYNSGAFYDAHMDSFKNSNSRRLSSVLFLNKNRVVLDGGLLQLYSPINNFEEFEGRDFKKETPILEIVPEFGKLILFWSEKIPHRVTPSHKPRRSLTGWFRA